MRVRGSSLAIKGVGTSVPDYAGRHFGSERVMPDLPLVSVIIPTFNSRRWIREAIDSVLEQTWRSLEVIVVDDGSTDGTGEMLQAEYGTAIRYIFQANKGLPAARNAGLRIARGRYVQFLDADDVLLPEKIELQVTMLEGNPQISVAYSSFAWLSGDPPSIEPARLRRRPPSGDVWADLLRGNFIVVHAALARLDEINAVGGFNEGLPACEDYDLWLRLSARGALFLHTPEVGVLYRRTQNSMSTNLMRQIGSNLLVLNRSRTYRKFGAAEWLCYCTQSAWLWWRSMQVRAFSLVRRGEVPR